MWLIIFVLLGEMFLFTFISMMVTMPDCLASGPEPESNEGFFELVPLPEVPVKPAATCSPNSRKPFTKDLEAFKTVAV